MATESLILSSGFSKFHYTVSDMAGRVRGELRLKTLPKDPITLKFDGRRFDIDYARTSDRSIANDFRFSLVAGNDSVMANAEKATGKQDFVVDIGAVAYRFEKRSGLFSFRYALIDGNGTIACTLTEITGLSLWKRRFRLELGAEVDGAIGIFLFFLAVNLRYR
jgi:hypothetical protein